ncbi:MAG TPA: nucleotidyltransferase domain-containing protein, partial [Campylobacterales bacterium]|nr:nucleotidyltransferase domain-containing protein [Campylobacterales bacterium]
MYLNSKHFNIFGSYADGSATNKSDIDIAYLSTEALSQIQRWEISQKLAILLSNDVDLIELSSTNTIFRYQIL